MAERKQPTLVVMRFPLAHFSLRIHSEFTQNLLTFVSLFTQNSCVFVRKAKNGSRTNKVVVALRILEAALIRSFATLSRGCVLKDEQMESE